MIPPVKTATRPNKYLAFFIRATDEMCRTGVFPTSFKKRWSREETAQQIGAYVAYHPECPKKFRRNAVRASKAARGQWYNIFPALNDYCWGQLTPGAFGIINLTEGIYCTNRADDPNRTLIYERRKAQGQGFVRSANNSRQPGEEGVELQTKLIPFRVVT